MRTLSSAQLAALNAPGVAVALLIEGAFDTATLRFWSGYGPFDWGGFTWTGAANVLTVSEVEETGALEASSLTITLNGIPAATVGLALNEPYQRRSCKIYEAMLDPQTGAMIGDPALLRQGLFNVMTVRDGQDECTISITVDSELNDLLRARTRRVTNEDQKTYYPDDLGFEFIAALQDMDLKWGGQ